jgi:hypothetical protein
MTYAQAIALQKIDPITILEIDTSQNESLFVYEEPGIAKLTLISTTIPDFDFWDSSDDYYSTTKVNVSSVQAYDGTDWLSYSKTTSLTNCRIQNKSFYYNITTQTIYIHFDDFDPWYLFETITLGIASGWSNKAFHDGNIYYDPRLVSRGISISRNKNADFYGVTRYDPMTFTLINEGDLDEFITTDVYGKSGRVKVVMNNPEEYEADTGAGTEDLSTGHDWTDYTATFTVDGTTITLDSETTNVATTVTAINTALTTAGITSVEAYASTDYVGIKSTDTGEDVTFTLAAGTTDALSTLGLTAGTYTGTIDYPTETLFTGRVENVPRISHTEMDITLADLRKFLSKNIPNKYYDQTTYTNLNDDDVGKVVPFAFGNIRGAELVCINLDESSPTNYTFKLADTSTWNLKSGQTVITYVDAASTANLNFSNTAGTIQIAATNVEPENQVVTADFVGYVDDSNDEIINGLDVIKNLITEYAGVEYTSDNYDTTEWASATLDAYDISLFIDERMSIIDVINKISTSLLGLFYITDDGKYSFKYTDYDIDSVKTISKEELLDFVEAIYDSEEYLTSVIVKYSPHQESGRHRRVIEDSLEESIYETYKVYRSKEFETIIDNATDAADYATRRQTFSKQIRPEFEIELGYHHSDLELLDNITIEMDRVYTDWYGLIKCHIIGIEKDLNDYKVILKLKYIEDVTITSCLTALDGGYSDTVSEIIVDGGAATHGTVHCTYDGGTSA